MAAVDPFGLTPEEAVRWFQEKGYQLSFDWRDMWQEQHARAFTVAKATQLEVLADLRAAVDDAIKNGSSLGQFKAGLKPLLQERGWWGEKELVDPVTGQKKTVQLGSPSRLRTIYQTNLNTAQAAGRWERMQRVADRRPYARYVAVLDGRERDAHRQWHGTVLPIDDPWWDTHAPPNGWGCRCKMQQLSRADLDRYGYQVSDAAPPSRMVTWRNDRTGQTIQVPAGIDPGFAYNPGKAPRGFTPPDNAPPLTPVQSFDDLGLPRARDVGDRPRAPAPWPQASSRAELDALAQAFRELFSIPHGQDSAPVSDPTGDQTDFNVGMLDYFGRKEGARASFTPVAKATVEDPAEIWMVPFRRRDGSVVMRKRYIGLFQEQSTGGYLVVVERGDDGYAAWTAYPSRSIDSQRSGYLLYRRPAP